MAWAGSQLSCCLCFSGNCAGCAATFSVLKKRVSWCCVLGAVCCDCLCGTRESHQWSLGLGSQGQCIPPASGPHPYQPLRAVRPRSHLSILQDDGTIGGRRYWAVGWAPEGGLCLTLAFLLTAELQQLREQFLLSVLLLQGAQVLHGGHR